MENFSASSTMLCSGIDSYFHTEDYPGNVQRLEPLLMGQPLDALMVWAINQSMEHLLYRNRLPVPHGKEV